MRISRSHAGFHFRPWAMLTMMPRASPARWPMPRDAEIFDGARQMRLAMMMPLLMSISPLLKFLIYHAE